MTNTVPLIPEWEIGDRLRKAREIAGMQMGELAEIIDVHRQSVARWERGEARPRRHVVTAWADATGVDVYWLETGDRRPLRLVGTLQTKSTACPALTACLTDDQSLDDETGAFERGASVLA